MRSMTLPVSSAPRDCAAGAARRSGRCEAVGARSPSGDPWLLTPGPLTTSPEVKAAARHDYGSRDLRFIEINRRMRERLVAIAGGQGTHVCVPLQGSGTFVVEAMLGTFVPRDGKVLILVNGAYGRRMAKICEVAGRCFALLEAAEEAPVEAQALAGALAGDAAVSHVAVVYCETTSGLVNPLDAIARVCEEHSRGLLVDAMSAFGALPLDARTTPFEAMAAASGKCLESTPGLGFCIARREALERARGNAHALSLDLCDQYLAMERDGQWRFTPPVQTILSLDRALEELEAEGGAAAREARYRENLKVLVEGMRRLGFETLLPDAVQAPIIVTFRMPADPRFGFESFYERMRRLGYVIYPGKLTAAPSFRIGCIGRLGPAEMRGALAAVEAVLGEMGVSSGAPAVRPAPDSSRGPRGSASGASIGSADQDAA